MKSSFIAYQLINKQRKALGVQADYSGLLVSLSLNRLLFWFSKNNWPILNKRQIQLLRKIRSVGEKKEMEMNRTLLEINDISKTKQLDYIIVKKKRTLPYISSDLDVLVKKEDFDCWIDLFQSRGFHSRPHKTLFWEHGEHNSLVKKGCGKIDLTSQFDWQEKQYFDSSFLWDHADRKKHQLSDEADFAVNLGAIIFKKVNFCLLDYLYLKNLMKKSLNWSLISQQAKKHCWLKAYRKSLDFLNSLDPTKNCFPKLFPLKLMTTIFWEKFKHQEFSFNYFLYFVFVQIRNFLLGKKYFPFFVYWYPFKNIAQVEGEKIKL